MLLKLANFIKKHYKLVLLISFLFTLLSIYWISKLKLNMQMMDMLPQNQPQVTAYKKALDNFTGIDLISIGIEGNEKDIKNYIEDVSKKVKALNQVDDVMYKGETEFLKKHGLLLLKKRELESITPMLQSSSIKDFVKGLNENFEREYIAGQDSDKISKDKEEMLTMFNVIEDFLLMFKKDKLDTNEIKEISDQFIVGPKYVISSDRSMGLMFVKTPIAITDIDILVPFINKLEKVVKKSESKHNVKAGLTGFLVLQRDEMESTTKDMQVSFILALVLIIIIFIIGFRLLRYTILALIPLLVGITWAMGLTYVFIGSLNVFTAMMGAILIGIGIDYSIHIIAIYTEERAKGTSVTDSITAVFQKSVKGIVTGAFTTAVGFMMFVISSFPAFKEFGITLGIGIICTLIASIFILPSLLIIFGKKDVSKNSRKELFMPIYNKYVLKKPWIIITFFIVLIVLSVFRFKEIQFSKSIKDIEPKGLESLEINDKMIEKFDFSNDITLCITKTIEEAHEIKEQTDDMDTIGHVESIAQYVPLKQKQIERLKMIKAIKNNTFRKVDYRLYLNELKEELYRLEDNIIEISDLAYMSGEEKIISKCDYLVESNVFKSLADNLSSYKTNIANIQQSFIKNFKSIVLNVNSDKIITLNDVPKRIKDSYIGNDGTFLTTMYPNGDVWTNEFQPLYINEIKSINKPLTGSSLLNIEVMSIAGKEGTRILLLVVICIFFMLIIDFMSFRYAFLAMIPMGLTLLLLIGIMVWFDIKFDYVNIIALPIIIGIGVDDGIHLIHRYRIEKNLLVAVKSTGRGIFLTTVTTMAAFGTMIISKYQGFGSFGRLLMLGIGLAYLLTIFLLGAIIRLFDKKEYRIRR